MFDDRLNDLCMKWLVDHVYAIRQAATVTVRKLVTTFGMDWAKEAVIPKGKIRSELLDIVYKQNSSNRLVLELASDNNYLKRMTMLFCINELCKAFNKNEIEALLLPTIIKMSEDSVPNVRFNVAKTLGQIEIESKVLEEKVRFISFVDFYCFLRWNPRWKYYKKTKMLTLPSTLIKPLMVIYVRARSKWRPSKIQCSTMIFSAAFITK